MNEKSLEELLRLKDKYQADIQYYKEKSNLNDPTLKSLVENLEQKLDEVQKIINKKKLDNMQDKLMGAINNVYDNTKTSPTVNTSSTTSEDNLKDDINEKSDSKDENISETPDEPKKEEPKNNVENSIPEKELPEVIESPLDNADSKKGENKDTDLNAKKPKEEKKSKKKFKIKNVRKSIKNIAKKTVIKISALAVTLVLIAAGVHSCSMDKKDTKQRNEVVDQIDNENGIITYKSTASTENNYDVSPVGQETTEKKTESYSETQSQVNTELESKKDIQTLDVGVNVEPITEKSSETEEAISQYTNQYDVVNTDTETNNLDDGIIYLNNTDEITPSEYNDNTSIHIGSEVTVDGNIHDDEYDAYYNENNQTSYYGTEPKRVVIGTGIVNDDGMNVIYAYNPDANQKIDELLNEGGEMVSILTANKEKYLQNYDGSTILTPEEIKSSAEGWYNINDVSINNGKGMSR